MRAVGLLLFAGAALSAQERGSWVVRIGTDTVALETYQRTATGLRGELVTRSPVSLHRIYTVTYDAAGPSYELVTHNIGGAPNIPMEARTGGPSSDRFPYLFPAVGLIEDAVRAVRARHTDSATVTGVQMTNGSATTLTIKLFGRDSVHLYLGPIVGAFVGTLDPTDCLTRISGQQTTEKYDWERVRELDLAALGPKFAGRPIASLSPRETTTVAFGGGGITITYGSPSVRGRTIFGALTPWGQVWRAGANAATTFTTTAPVSVAGHRVPAGTYTLWILPTPTTWTLIINTQTLAPCGATCPAPRAPLWGTDYSPDSDLVRVPMLVQQSPALVERFGITATPQRGLAGDAAVLTFAWEHTRASVEIRQPK
ncbi:MAG TPA: DUF2911 domain-containing protein [Gemmatimonadales bacterium]|nr:DUF2911 domain-containing protein [Gemmatimonadales bacterium]